MEKIYDRIKKSRLAVGMSQQELAARLGYKSKVSISCIESGKKAITCDMINEIAEVLQVSAAYLMGLNEQNAAGAKKIPLIGRIAAGLPIYAEENIEGFVMADVQDGNEKYFALRVEGDSMDAARIYDGGIIIVRQQNIVHNGDIAVVLVDDETATVKVFRKEGHFVYLTPQSHNPVHKTQVYDLRKVNIMILGKVIESRTLIC